MLLLQAEELEKQGLLESTSTEFSFQGKLLKKVQVFSKRFRQAAIDTCQEKLDEGKFSVIVESSFYISVWEEKQVTPVSPQTSNPPPIAKTNQPTPATESKKVKLDSNFLKRCQQELSYFVGPIAEYVIETTLEDNSSLTPKQFIEVLAKEIPDSQQAKEFKKRLEDV